MAPFDGFVGGSYTGLALTADGEVSQNFYVERIESANAQKTKAMLLSKPGLQAYVSIPGATSVSALCEINGRVFFVASSNFYELGATAPALWGPVTQGHTEMVASQSQVLILSGTTGYLFTLASNAFQMIPNFPTNITKVAVSDGYFLALQGTSQNFFISGINDGINWNVLDYGNAQGEPGNLVSFIVDHRQLWLLGNTHFEVFYDSGNADFPFTRLEGATGEQGCGAVDSVARCDNTIFWLGGNRDGAGIVWRANGYTPMRISTHAIEAAIQSYPTFADASGYCYQENGHTFYRLDFPSANNGLGATWVFDVASGYWHERTYFNVATGTTQADLSRCYCYANGKHLTGDYQSGTIYQQSMAFYTDAGAPIRRVRSAPALARGGLWSYYTELRLLLQVGMGLDGGVTPGSDPQVMLQCSDDGGFTWGAERTGSMGRIGQYNVLVRWAALGRSMNRCFRIVITEPIFVAIFGADLDLHG